MDRENPLLVPDGKGFLDRVVVPERLPAWMREKDIAILASEYQRTGFRAGLNLYRNIDRNWELTAPWLGALIHQPAMFIAGTRDPVIAGPRGEAAISHMHRAVPNLTQLLLEGGGHWIQQERAEQVNAGILEFLRKVTEM
jgi:pimeloyl-ACP methyl ester carboxylesterase